MQAHGPPQTSVQLRPCTGLGAGRGAGAPGPAEKFQVLKKHLPSAGSQDPAGLEVLQETVQDLEEPVCALRTDPELDGLQLSLCHSLAVMLVNQILL